MKLAIMQPYLFPYLGYFQLIQEADAFVVYDDVNYIKGGWINRNFILGLGEPQRITLPLRGASPNKLINEISLDGSNKKKLVRTIQQRYSKAPQFRVAFPLIEDILTYHDNNLFRFLYRQLRQLCDFLGLEAAWHISSGLKKDVELHGQDRILAICEELSATHYINAKGGRGIYSRDAFAKRRIKLSFLKQKDIFYPQFGGKFVPNLSIVDVVMFNNYEQCLHLLKAYELD